MPWDCVRRRRRAWSQASTYIKSKESTVAQVDTLQGTDVVLAVARLLHDTATIGGKSMDTPVGNTGTLDKTHTLKLGKVGQLSYALVSEVAAAGEIDVSDTSARLGQANDRSVGDASTMAQVNVVEVSAELGDGPDSSVGKLSALG